MEIFCLTLIFQNILSTGIFLFLFWDIYKFADYGNPIFLAFSLSIFFPIFFPNSFCLQKANFAPFFSWQLINTSIHGQWRNSNGFLVSLDVSVMFLYTYYIYYTKTIFYRFNGNMDCKLIYFKYMKVQPELNFSIAAFTYSLSFPYNIKKNIFLVLRWRCSSCILNNIFYC